MNITLAKREDLRDILDLQYLAYQSEAEIYNDYNIPPLKQTLEEVKREFDKGVILKATDESGNIIGSVRAFSENGSVYIGKLIVHPNRQRQGIGTALLSAVEAHYPDRRFELFTGSKSAGNIALYERLGYKIFTVKRIDENLEFVYLEKRRILRLRPYRHNDAIQIVKWCKDEYAFRQWSADRYPKFPITAEDMNRLYDSLDIWGLTAFDETGIVGHLTMRCPNGNFDEVRFGFVIVDCEKRGMGYGKKMLSLAVKYAFEFVKVKKISLGVFENNTAALQCYKSVGFKVVERDKTESYNCLGETWNCIEMEITNENDISCDATEA